MTPGEPPRDADEEDEDLFGIDLGHRGDRTEDASRDEVEAPPPVRAIARTLSDRLASAKADRDEDRRQPPVDDDPNDEAEPAE